MKRYDIKSVPSSGDQRLGASDVPIAFEVGEENEVLVIRIVYAGGMREAKMTEFMYVGHGAEIEAVIGQVSKRLLGVRIQFDRAQANEEAARILTKKIDEGLSKLRDESTLDGTRLNYEAAAAGLDITKAPPAWLIEAMKNLAPRHPSHQ